MTLEELKAEALKQGYRLQKIPEYQCSCYVEYPNDAYKCKNGKWKCVDKYELVEQKKKGFDIRTYCRRKGDL